MMNILWQGDREEVHPQVVWLLRLIELTSSEGLALKLIDAFFWDGSLNLKGVMGEAVLDV